MAKEVGDKITVNGEEYKVLMVWEHGEGFVYQAKAPDGTTRKVYSQEIDTEEEEPEPDKEPEPEPEPDKEPEE